MQDRQTIQPALDEACSQAVEDFYLKPVLHVSVSRKGQVQPATLWNIGNDDAKGFAVELLRHGMAGKLEDTVLTPAFCPQERKSSARACRCHVTQTPPAGRHGESLFLGL